MARRAIFAAALGACALISLHAPARADVIWDFSYSATVDFASSPSYSLNQALHADGQLITTEIGANKYLIVGITGTYDGMAISLIPAGGYAGNDNLLLTGGATYLDSAGLSFVAGGQSINLYGDVVPGKYDEAVEEATYEVTNNGSFTVSPAQTAVPEPASLALLGTALAGLGLARRRKRT